MTEYRDSCNQGLQNINYERLSTNNKLTIHKALIRFVITYACLAWEFWQIHI
jgi:hypothetical protein